MKNDEQVGGVEGVVSRKPARSRIPEDVIPGKDVSKCELVS